jgi:hypothetical protein
MNKKQEKQEEEGAPCMSLPRTLRTPHRQLYSLTDQQDSVSSCLARLQVGVNFLNPIRIGVTTFENHCLEGKLTFGNPFDSVSSCSGCEL